MRVRWMAVFAVVALLAAACGDDDTGTTAGNGATGGSTTTAAEASLPGLQTAIDEMVAAGIEADAAECYVNGLVSEFGLDQLEALGTGSDEVPPEVALKALELLDECNVAIEDIGFGEPPDDFRELAWPREDVDGPYTYGEDATLDALWDACEAGSGEACDNLYYDSPFGSEYEAFGNTCGNRPELLYDCSSLGG